MLIKFLVAGQLLLSPAALGFVHVSADQPTLPVTREAPRMSFIWNGSSPSIKNKGGLGNPSFTQLSDQQMMLTLLRIAFDTWNSVEGSFLDIELTEDGSASIDSSDQRYAIVVKNVTNLSAAAFAQPSNRSTKSEQNQSSLESNPAIIHDCDITVSSKGVDAKDLLSVLIHEIGHCIGLGHPHTNYNSIMSYARPRGSTTLGLDDMAGIIFLYPSSDIEKKEMVACGTLGRGSTGKLAALLLLVPILVPWRRGKSKTAIYF